MIPVCYLMVLPACYLWLLVVTCGYLCVTCGYLWLPMVFWWCYLCVTCGYFWLPVVIWWCTCDYLWLHVVIWWFYLSVTCGYLMVLSVCYLWLPGNVTCVLPVCRWNSTTCGGVEEDHWWVQLKSTSSGGGLWGNVCAEKGRLYKLSHYLYLSRVRCKFTSTNNKHTLQLTEGFQSSVFFAVLHNKTIDF